MSPRCLPIVLVLTAVISWFSLREADPPRVERIDVAPVVSAP